MFQNLKNKVFSTVANCLRPHLQEKQKEETVVVETTGTKVIQHGERYYSQDCKMTPEKAQELLKLSFQRGPEEFLITKPGQTGYAMDAESPDCQLAQKNMFGLNGAASSVIYSFFAKHGFIGWQLCAMLSQHWLINRACRLPNEDALANGWTLEWQKQDETLDDVEADKRAELLTLAVERGNQSFDLAEKALKFGINRSIYGQALAYFIIEGEDPSTPLNLDGIQPKSFKGITVVEPYWAFPDWGEDAMTPGSLNFYRPEFYTVGGKRIHRSRLCVKTFVEVPDILKPSYYFGGVPLTQMIYERTYAAEKTANEVPELALTKRMLVADANLEEAMANPQVLRQKMEILAHFRNNNGVYFKDRPESVTQLDTNLADLDANVWTQYQLVASVASIPADRLLCTSPKGFQSTGEYERKTYAQTLQAAYQEVAFREFLETALALILKSEFGVADPITLIFNPIDSPTEAERAQTQLVQANRDSALINAGIISAEEAREALAADKGSGYSNLPAEMPKSAEMPELSDLFGNNEEDKPEGEENGGNGENGAGTDRAADEWKESEHPRDDDGKFSSNGGGNKSAKSTPAPQPDFKGKGYKAKSSSWSGLIAELKEAGLKVDSADLSDPSRHITGYDAEGNQYKIEVDKYSDGQYEAEGEGISLVKQSESENRKAKNTKQEARQKRLLAAIENLKENEEVVVEDLRDDLKQYGVTNDIAIKWGSNDAKGKGAGVKHILENHGKESFVGIVNAVVNGQIKEYHKQGQRLILEHDGYKAILSLNDNGKKKVWLLTGYKIDPDHKNQKNTQKKAQDEISEISAQSDPTQYGPTFWRPALVACAIDSLTDFFNKSKV